MKIKKAFQLSLNMLIHSKLRSYLTIVGIIIGIAAVVSIIAVSQGAQKSLQDKLGNLGADILTVSPGGESKAFGAGGSFRIGGGEGGVATASSTAQKNLTSKDITVIAGISNVKYVMGTISARETVNYLGKSTTLNIKGVDPSLWTDFTSTALQSGRYLTQGDTNSVVVGNRIATSVFTNGLQISRLITIGNQTFKIVGILQSSGGSDDSSIFMPISSARNIFDVGGIDFSSISVKLSNVDLTNDTINEMTNDLMLSRQILNANSVDFSVSSPLAAQATITSSLNSISLFLAAIAAISLLVGAVGIANTMFTSVLEKTKEIGIMKSIGAQNKDILIIFLFNSGLLGLVGGIGGIILGVFGASLIGGLVGGSGIGRLSFGSTYFSPTLIIGSFLLSIVIGMIAGAIPAYRASKLRPVDALRYE